MTETAAPAEPADEVQLELLKEPREPRVIFVDNPESLELAAKTLSEATGLFAVDAERASGFKYSQRAYLVQVHRRGTPIFLIDPAALAPDIADAPKVFANLAAVMQKAPWILHSASQDLPCLREMGIECPELIDTELGSRIAGFERVGLGAVCERLLGLRLAKEHSAVDWSIRPLHADWLNYAALDVDVLPDLHDALILELESQAKLDWAKQEFAHTLELKRRDPKVDRWRGMSGMQHLREQRSLAIARELWLAREALAAKVDVSPGRLIPDSSIVAVVQNPPKTRPELASFKAFTGRARGTYLDTWWGALEKGLTTRDLPPVKLPAIGTPNHRNWPQRFPDADARLQAAKAVINDLSKQHNVPAENILKPDSMRELCFNPPQSPDLQSLVASLLDLGARHWQIELVAPGFITAMQAKPVVVEPAEAEQSEKATEPGSAEKQ
jgi:ribonuclease D